MVYSGKPYSNGWFGGTLFSETSTFKMASSDSSWVWSKFFNLRRVPQHIPTQPVLSGWFVPNHWCETKMREEGCLTLYNQALFQQLLVGETKQKGGMERDPLNMWQMKNYLECTWHDVVGWVSTTDFFKERLHLKMRSNQTWVMLASFRSFRL